jgi:hypothetical protein
MKTKIPTPPPVPATTLSSDARREKTPATETAQAKDRLKIAIAASV